MSIFKKLRCGQIIHVWIFVGVHWQVTSYDLWTSVVIITELRCTVVPGKLSCIANKHDWRSSPYILVTQTLAKYFWTGWIAKNNRATDGDVDDNDDDVKAACRCAIALKAKPFVNFYIDQLPAATGRLTVRFSDAFHSAAVNGSRQRCL